MTSQEFARSLRLVADWYDMHSDMPTLSELRIYHVEETREEAARIARALMPVDKQAESEMFTLSRTFGAVPLQFVFYRSTVCTPRVVGTRTIAAIPEQPARDVDVIEWDCKALLDEGVV